MVNRLQEILSLDPVADHQRIVALDVMYEFPWDITRALEFALFRTYAVPSISKLLDSTGEFYVRPQKRYDDTDLLVSVILQYGYDSPEGKDSIRRMNQMHGRFEISNDDYLYVLSTFVFEPINWLKKYGWRPMVEAECLAMFTCWREIGKRMHIVNIPSTIDEFERFKVEYEAAHFRFSETNFKVGSATVNLFLSWFPALTRSIGKRAIYALMDPPLLDAFGFPHPTLTDRRVVTAGLKTLAFSKRILPKRRSPVVHDYSMKRRSYPNGYGPDDVGPPYMCRKPSA